MVVSIVIGYIKEKSNKLIKCKYCGHEFDCDESKTIIYSLGGKQQKAQECPKCGKYTEIK